MTSKYTRETEQLKKSYGMNESFGANKIFGNLIRI